MQLLDFLENTRQLNRASHTYQKSLSTTTTITEVCDKLYQATEEKLITEVMTVDQSAAFDVLNHEILIRKFKHYNLSTEAVKLFQSYLSFRTQYKTIGASNSRMTQIDRGIPQGSMVGPLLFCIYTNEMTEVTRDPECLNAAFDVLNHEILIRKFKHYNLSTEAVKLFQSYLSFRTQYKTIGASNSRMTQIDRGIPQGSMVGPLLFCIYTNEMTEVTRDPECLNVKHQNNEYLFGETCNHCGMIKMYADDTTYVVSHKKREQNAIRIKKTLIEIEKFLIENEMHLNVGKTHLLECMIPQKRGNLKGTHQG